jgi:hypothetical protein
MLVKKIEKNTVFSFLPLQTPTPLRDMECFEWSTMMLCCCHNTSHLLSVMKQEK